VDQGSVFEPRSGESEQVAPVPRLKVDLGALGVLTTSAIPLLRLVRPNQVGTVQYGFGDASRPGFGSTFWNPGEILYKHGVWGSDDEGMSLNWRELTNLVEFLALDARELRLQGCEVFFSPLMIQWQRRRSSEGLPLVSICFFWL
jgi:hypothetical protein